MFSLKKLALATSTSRRGFLTSSSMLMLGLAASTVFPKPLKAAIDNYSSGSQRLSLEELDSISLYVNASQSVAGLPSVTFDEPTDEARYLAQIIFQELIKYRFTYENSSLANELGLTPNQVLISPSSTQHIYRLHENYFSAHLPEYISAMLQSAHRTSTHLSQDNRLPSNTWDMVKANKAIAAAEKGEEFRTITDKLYVEACRHLTANQGAQALLGYANPEAIWAHQLKDHYEKDDVLAGLVAEVKVEEDSLASLLNVKNKIDGVINKITALNLFAQYNPVPAEELEELEQRMFGVVFAGIGSSMLWGSASETNCVLGRTQSFNDVVSYLRDAQACGSQVVADYWNQFFNTTQPQDFWTTLSTLGLNDLSLRDPVGHQKIFDRYPALVVPSRGVESFFISGLTLLLGISHFAWATANDTDDYVSPVDLFGLGAAFSNDGLTVLYESMLTNFTRQMLVSKTAPTPAAPANMSKWSQWMNRLRTKGRMFNNKERKVAEKMFGTQRVPKFISKVTPWLAGIAVVAAFWGFVSSIIDGEGSVFASLNLLVATLGFTAVIFSWAAPVAAVIAVFGLLLFIAEWIYKRFNPTPPPPSPVKRFTDTVMRDLILPSLGSFVCRTGGNKVSPLYVTELKYDFNTLPSQHASAYTELKALITSKNGYIYNFANIQYPRRGRTTTFFANGTPDPIPSWNASYLFSGRCTHVAESVDSQGRTKAMFAATLERDTQTASLHLSDNLDIAPLPEAISDMVSSNETIYDIVGINNMSECTFIIFTRWHIYQYTPTGGLIRVSEWYGENAEQVYGESAISSLTAFSGDDFVYFFYQSRLDQNQTISHHVLKKDAAGVFSKISLVRTTQATIIPGVSTQVGTYGDYAGIHIGTGDDSRMVGIAANGNVISRFGMMVGEPNSGDEFSCYNDVAFQLSNNVIYGIYKNAYISS